MGKIIFFVSGIFISNFVLSQNFQEAYDIKVQENSKLKDSIVNILKIYKTKVNMLNDSINLLNKKIITDSKELKNVKDLKDKKELTEIIITKNKIIDSLQFKNDSLFKNNKLTISNWQNKNRLNELKLEECKSELEKESEKNKLILGKIVTKYNSNDLFVFNLDLESINNDLFICKTLFPSQIELIHKLENWIIIKKAEFALTLKFNKLEIIQQINLLTKLPQSNITKELIEDLNKYEEKTEAIKKLIKLLEEKNLIKVRGTDPALIEDKQKEVFTTIYFEIAYTPINLSKYHYLNKIVNKIYTIKDDIDASVLPVLQDL